MGGVPGWAPGRGQDSGAADRGSCVRRLPRPGPGSPLYSWLGTHWGYRPQLSDARAAGRGGRVDLLGDKGRSAGLTCLEMMQLMLCLGVCLLRLHPGPS